MWHNPCKLSPCNLEWLELGHQAPKKQSIGVGLAVKDLLQINLLKTSLEIHGATLSTGLHVYQS